MTAVRVISLAFACLAATPAFALDQGEYRFNGFGTVGFTHLGGEEEGRGYGIQGQTNDSWRGDQLSKFGAQLQYGLTDTIGATVQVTAKAEKDDWKANLEWAYLSWQANQNLMLRAGRLRTPVFMYSETLDVGYSYPWLRLPDEVYSLVYLTSYEGADAVYNLPLSYGSVSVQLAAGQAKDDDTYVYDEDFEMDYENLFGANVSLATNSFGTFRIGYVEADLSADFQVSVSGVARPIPLLQLDEAKGKFTSVGHQYDNGTWVSANEWVSRSIENDDSGSSDAFYMMGGRRFGDFLAHVTYAQLDDDDGRQSSWTYGLNYNLLPTLTLKGEYKRVDTTGGYDGLFVRSAREVVANAMSAPARNFDGDIISVGVDFVF